MADTGDLWSAPLLSGPLATLSTRSRDGIKQCIDIDNRGASAMFILIPIRRFCLYPPWYTADEGYTNQFHATTLRSHITVSVYGPASLFRVPWPPEIGGHHTPNTAQNSAFLLQTYFHSRSTLKVRSFKILENGWAMHFQFVMLTTWVDKWVRALDPKQITI
jgi:hypothetical protein